MHRRWAFRITVLTMLVVAGWWALDEPSPPTDSESPAGRERLPDYFTEDFTIVATNARGTPVWELTAPRMVYFADQDTWRMDSPDLLYHADSGKPWRLVAERGRAWSGLTEAMLDGDVIITRAAGPDNPAARLDTTDVRLWPNRRLAETQRPAIYRTDGTHVKGIGARGEFDRERLQLHSEVKARYASPAD